VHGAKKSAGKPCVWLLMNLNRARDAMISMDVIVQGEKVSDGLIANLRLMMMVWMLGATGRAVQCGSLHVSACR
jgi:hypothetical protein